MLELPEAAVTAAQMRETLKGKVIARVSEGNATHRMAWFSAPPQEYDNLLGGREITGTEPRGGLIEISVGDQTLLAGDGANLTYLAKEAPLPKKYLLLFDFDDGSRLYMTVQMYGGLWCYPKGKFPADHYMAGSYEKPSPLTNGFDRAYFETQIFGDNKTAKKSAKAALATEQRIPGLGNGVLQDILFNARIHPKRRMNTLGEEEKEMLYAVLKSTLKNMTDQGGRDTEKDLFGQKGSYKTVLSKNTAKDPCPVCCGSIVKAAYMGGSVYFCPRCQKES